MTVARRCISVRTESVLPTYAPSHAVLVRERASVWSAYEQTNHVACRSRRWSTAPCGLLELIQQRKDDDWAPSGGDSEVSIEKFAFGSDDITVSVGDTIARR
ncbi:MAG: hypothetical protein QGD89_10640, partial [Actinomycetota bacterium]|nr:hypothetical protein [Actinomycetota bacterium]